MQYFCDDLSEIEDRENNTLRIIPVSSVGSKFIEEYNITEETSEMKIRKGARAKPWNVEMPLCCVLPDLIKQIRASVEKEKRQAESIQYVQSLSIWERIQMALPKIVKRIVPDSLNFKHALESMLEQNANTIRMSDEERRLHFEAEKSKAVQTLSDNTGAFKAAFNDFELLTQKLNTNFPESQIL